MSAVTSPPSAQALPKAPPVQAAGGRNRAFLAIGLLLMIVGGLAAGSLVAVAQDRSQVVVVRRPVRAGTALQDADLGEAALSADASLHPIAASRRDSLVGRTVAVNIAAGTLLTDAQLSSGPLVGAGQAVVGLSLRAGQLPPHLRPLDRVRLVSTAPAAEGGTGSSLGGRVLVQEAQVLSAESGDGGTSVAVIVAERDAPNLAALAAAGQVGVVLLGGPP